MDISSLLIWSVTILLFLTGLAGTVVPFLPGILVIAAGAVWQGVMGDRHIPWWGWAVLTLMVAGGMVFDKISGGLGAHKFGSTKAGIIGALLGALIGPFLFTPLVGLIVAPFLGAVIGELVFARQTPGQAAKAGTGATLGMLTGLAFEFLTGLMMISWFFACYYLF